MRTHVLLTVVGAMGTGTALAQTPVPVVVGAADIAWQPAPPVLEPGAQAAVLAGNPSQPGPVTLRVRVPDGYRIAAHRHPIDEQVTVLSGTLCLAAGVQRSDQGDKCVGAGGFLLIPANVPHTVRASGATEYQIHAIGSFEMIYVNAGDDPSRRPR